jgi:hypothetical protein
MDTPEPPAELAPEDFYFEGPYLVFTAAYHLKRGYCCNSGCRHCPYQTEHDDGSKSSESECLLLHVVRQRRGEA